MVLIGLPWTVQVKVAGLPKSMVCVLGSISAFSGAVTVKTVSTLSPPTELLTIQRYLPESSTRATRMIRVPLTWRTRSFSWTGWRLDVPSMNLYHLKQKDKSCRFLHQCRNESCSFRTFTIFTYHFKFKFRSQNGTVILTLKKINFNKSCFLYKFV